MKYKAIMLVIASSDSSSDIYFLKKIKQECRPFFPILKKVYHSYMNEVEDIKIFFVYGNSADVVEDYDLVYDVEENDYPGIITKTLMAMEQIEREYDYDFIIRTNLSTLWDMHKLSKRLDELPKQNCIAGSPVKFSDAGINYDYIAGFDMVLSRDLVNILINHKEETIQQKTFANLEDLSMFNTICKYATPVKLTDACHTAVGGLKYDNLHVCKAIYNQRNADHYRVRNSSDRNMDKALIQKLAFEMYGKTI